ncbi:hypothetical protein J3F84DRAFT_43260 [Trichoderma pleuroticola]
MGFMFSTSMTCTQIANCHENTQRCSRCIASFILTPSSQLPLRLHARTRPSEYRPGLMDGQSSARVQLPLGSQKAWSLQWTLKLSTKEASMMTCCTVQERDKAFSSETLQRAVPIPPPKMTEQQASKQSSSLQSHTMDAKLIADLVVEKLARSGYCTPTEKSSSTMPIIGAGDLEVWIKANGSREPYLDPSSWAGICDTSYAVDVSRMWCRHLWLGAGAGLSMFSYMTSLALILHVPF